MQVDRYNHLQYPRDNGVGNNGKDTSLAAAATDPAGGKVSAGARLPGAPVPLSPLESVVLKVQLPDNASLGSAREELDIYGDLRKTSGRGEAGDAGLDRAADHQRAVERNAGVFTRITLDKDGVLVANKAQPQGSVEGKQPDFVALAVSAMREFSDEHERQKLQSFDFNPPEIQAPVSKFRGLQQLAARFNVFA